eukprot:COSAG05_NODE_7998_length_747_cov_1.425926_1_plen_207_part_01
MEPKHTWEESEGELRIHVTMVGANPKACDVAVADQYVKVNCAPYLLSVDLLGSVVDTASTVVYTAEGLTINLPKVEPQLWGELQIDPSKIGGKKGLAKRREASIDRQRQAAEAARQQRITQRSVHNRLATHTQIDLDNAQRNLVEERKAQEKRAAEDDVYAGLKELQNRTGAAAATSNRDAKEWTDDSEDDGIEDLPRLQGLEPEAE